MAGMSAPLGDSGALHRFKHNGRTFTVSRLTNEKKDEFALWMQGKALAAVMAIRKRVPLEVWTESYGETMRMIAGGDFAFYSEATQRAIRTPGGLIGLASVLFGCEEEEMVDLIQARGDDVRALIDTIFAESQVDPQTPAGRAAAAPAE